MCLLLIANNVHKEYKLILAANRDEFYERPTEPAKFWDEDKSMLAGKDLQAGGTWLGITRLGRIAALTNYRDMKNIKSDAPSRGALTTNFLQSGITPPEYYNSIKNNAGRYNGFNLVFGIKNDLYYFSNYSNDFKKIGNGIYGLSNALLDTPWPKVEKIKQRFADLITVQNFDPVSALSLLSDTETAPDELLPDTGIGLELERLLSSLFIKSEIYGTRSSTIILIDNQDNVTFIEKTYLPGTNDNTQVDFKFVLEPVS